MADNPEWRSSGHITGRRPDVRGMPLDADVEREFATHIEMLTEELVEQGLDPEEARREALRRFGDMIEAVRECQSSARSKDHRLRLSHFLDDRRQDLKFTLRNLGRSPGFMVVALLTLALGIGANTAIFSVVQNVLFKPLPFREPERIVQIFEVEPGGFLFSFSPPNFESVRERATLLDDIAVYYQTSFAMTGEGDPEVIPAMHISAGFFELLGVQPALGRSFTREDDTGGAEPVVILSHSMWVSRFGGDPDILGRTITLSDVPHTIVGVIPARFRFVDGEPDLWVPCAWTGEDKTNRGRHWLRVLGRLKPGTELETFAAELDAIATQLAGEYPGTNDGWQMHAIWYRDIIVREARTPLLILLGAVGLVLLIACANVANLSLVRGEVRGREMAVRSALGACRRRLLLQVLTESIVLALLGGMVGIGLAYIGLEIIVSSLGETLPRAAEISVNRSVLVFTLLISVVSGVLVGIAPAFLGMRRDPLSSFKVGSGQMPSGKGRYRLRGTLIVTEVALSLILLMGAGRLLNSFYELTHTEIGFEREHLLAVDLSLPSSRYPTRAHSGVFFSELLDDINRLPEVESASTADALPFTGSRVSMTYVPGKPEITEFMSRRIRITPGYFSTMRIPLISGRTIDEKDDENAPAVAVVDESFARHTFPNESPIGRQIAFGGDPDPFEIVGVVSDVAQSGFEGKSLPCVYRPNVQFFPSSSMTLVIRTRIDPADAANAIRQAVWARDPDLPVQGLSTMETIISDSVGSQRLQVLLLSIFATIAIILSVIGIYGLLSYVVGRRRAEIGIRSALGAGRGEIIWMVTRQGLVLTLLGVCLGTAGALALGRLFSSMLFGTSLTRPALLISLVLLMVVISAAGCLIPAARAAGIEPVDALRNE